jgi:VanZ family protein
MDTVRSRPLVTSADRARRPSWHLPAGVAYLALVAVLLVMPLDQRGPSPGQARFLWSAPPSISLTALRNALLNVALFVPAGFVFHAALREREVGSAGAAALVVLGAAGVSLAAESAQYFIPSRYSSIVDVVMNTGGAGLGVALHRVVRVGLR